MGKREFTKRQNGQRMATCRVDVHIDQKLVEFVAAKMEISPEKAIEKILGQVVFQAAETIGWRIPVVSGKAGEDRTFELVHSDGVDSEADAAAKEGDPFDVFESRASQPIYVSR